MRSWPETAPWALTLLGLAGCLAPGASLELSRSDGLSWFVEADERGIVRVLDGRTPGLAYTLRPTATAYLIQVPYAALGAVRPGVDEARLDRATLSEASSELEACHPRRFVSNEAGEHLEVPLAEVAEVRRFVGGALEVVADWPGVLDRLSVKVPVPPCRPRTGAVGPFLGEVGPLVREGDRLGSKLVAGEDADLGGIVDLFHLDEDTLLVALPQTLVLVGRGQDLGAAGILDLAAPSEDFGGSPTTEVRYTAGVALPPLDPGRGLRLYFLLQEWVVGSRRETTLGLRLIELEVDRNGFGSPRLVLRLSSDRIDSPRLAVSEDGRFVIGSRGQLWSGRLDDSALLQSESVVVVDSLVLAPPSPSAPWMPRLVGGGFGLTWLEGDPDDLGTLQRAEWSGGVVRPEDSVAALRVSLGPAGPRLFSASSVPSFHERGADGWRELTSWYPEALPACLDSGETCGRRRVRRGLGSGGVILGEDASLVHLLRECEAVFWVHPDRSPHFSGTGVVA